MKNVRFLEGLRAPLFFLLGSVFALPASGQNVSREDLARCSAMSSDAAKLACFESLAELDAAEPPATPPPTEPALSESKASPAPPAPAAAAVDDASAAPATTLAAPAPEDRADDFGREYLEDENEEEADTLTATVDEVTIDRTKRLVFRFANGQVWRQLEPRRFQYPRREAFEVVISRGVLGDYQLRVGGEGRMTRIKRVK